MGSTLTLVETARIEALLALLDPDSGGPCQVPGCTHDSHAHTGLSASEGGMTALAA
jgi:hypothetical protein